MNRAILDLARRSIGCTDPIAPKPAPIVEPEPLVNKPDAGTICFNICKYWSEGGTPAVPICVLKDGSVNCKFKKAIPEPEPITEPIFPEPEPITEPISEPEPSIDSNTYHFHPEFGYWIDEEDKKRSEDINNVEPEPITEPISKPEPPRNRASDFQSFNDINGSIEKKKFNHEDLMGYITSLFKGKNEGIINKKYNLDSFIEKENKIISKIYKIKKYSNLEELN